MSVVETSRAGDIGIVTLARPPVNAFDVALRRGLLDAIAAIDNDPKAEAIVVHGRGRGFSAGGDVREFGTPNAMAFPGLSRDVHARIESCRKPVVAAIHGLCLGGGLETALACHWRVSTEQARVGLPEVAVGALPLSGTQRMPRLLGLRRSADLIASGQIFVANEQPALFDRLVPGDDESSVVDFAIELARSLAHRNDRLRLLRDQPVLGVSERQYVADAIDAASTSTVRCALEAILAACDSAEFDTGLARARELYDAQMASAEAQARQREFMSGTRAP